MKPNLIITMGDPSGVGPEVTLKALASSRVLRAANFLIIGDGFVLDRVKRDLGLVSGAAVLDMANVSRTAIGYGKVSADFGRASIQYIDKALEILKAQEADGLVTAPINKSSVVKSGLSAFEGHTEYLAKNTGTKHFAMMFVGRSLKITLATRHIALEGVSRSLKVSAISSAIALTHAYLKNFFQISNPRIAVCGLNPHAGEGGIFGEEENKIIIPAIKKASKRIKGLCGPIASDVIFHHALCKKFDAVIAMYHDQGLIPFKLLHFKDGVNLTLGLPFIRTSPDHGTAFDIAGKGKADPSSMIEAILLASRLSAKAARALS